MRLKVRVFAHLKDYFEPELELVLPDASRAGDVIRGLSEKNPASAALLGACKIAVNEMFVDAEHPVNRDDVILVMPPFAGG